MIENELRVGYDACRQTLAERIAEPAPGRIQLLCGPRQVGKTT
jgi:predicted AAA+ superfamily ATPase